MSTLPTGWAAVRLDQVADVKLGRQRSPKNHFGSRMRPYLRAANVTWSGLNLSDVKEMNFTEQESDVFELLPGDVLVAEASGSASGVGKPALWRGEIAGCCFQNTLLRVRSRHLLPKYLLYLLQADALSGRLGEAARGVGIHHLGAARLSSWTVAIAPLAEQERIVAAIEERCSRLDAAEVTLRRTRRRLSTLRELETDQALVGDWPPVPLGEIAEIVGGVTKDTKREGDPRFVKVPYLRVANVQRGFLDLTEVATIRVSPEKARALALKPGDVLFNEGGDRDKLGRGWVWSGEVANCIHQNHVFRARLDEGFDPRFVSWYGNTFGRRWFEENGRQTTNLASLSLRTLKSFPVPAAPLSEQRRMVADLERRLSLIDALAAEVDAALKRSKVLRRSILQLAFAGKLVPRDRCDEPASALLERIAAERAAAPKPSRRRSKATA